MFDQLKKVSAWWWVGLAVALAALLYWKSPSFKQTNDNETAVAVAEVALEREHYKKAWEDQVVKNQLHLVEISNLKKKTQRTEISGSVQEPVFHEGQLAWRTVTWQASSDASIEESVYEALARAKEEAMSSVGEAEGNSEQATSSQTVTVYVNKDVTVKRQTVADVGVGIGTQGTTWGLFGFRVKGPLGAWSVVGIDTSPNVEFEAGAAGVKASF